MAMVYEYRNGLYQINNAYEVDNMTVDQAIDSIIDPTNIDGVITYDRESIKGYGDDAVLVMIDSEPYIIIGN